MIKHTIGPTDIYICESTAICIVCNPTETLAGEVADYIFTNNYTCGVIYHESDDNALALHRLVGGNIYTNIDQVEEYKKTLC